MGERDTANKTIREHDTQLATLKASKGDVEKLKRQIETLQGDNKAAAEKVKVKEDGLSLDEQIKKLQGAKNSKFMFNDPKAKPKFKGTKPGDTGANDPEQPVNPKDLSYEELCKYWEENPDANLE